MNAKRVLSGVSSSKEHPNCRKQIVNNGLRPNPSVQEWDGYALGKDGQLVLIGGLMRTQMARMIVEGHWSDAAMETIGK